MADQPESKIADGALLLGKYRVIREVGRGGMAAVYEAEQLSLGKKVALKVLAAELAASNVVIERFFREARAAASVRSPHIVDVYDSGRLEDGRPFIAMEMLDGESLYDRMARVRIIDIDTTLRVIVHCAKGLAKAHAAGIVHRDLKPENIFLTTDENGEELVKLLDFGLAKFYAPVNPDEKTKRLTREGAVFGTPAYMSPEQVKGQGTVDHRSDLWALGCMAYECLLGRPVWNMDQGVAMTFAAIATGPIPTPSRIRTDLPLAFDEWFKCCLARDPADRYQSAKELSDALVLVFGDTPSIPRMSAGALPTFARADGPPSSGPHVSALPLDPLRDVSSQDPSQPQTPPAPTTASLTTPPAARSRGSSAVRMATSGALVVASVSLAAFVWARYLKPQVIVQTVASTATVAPSAPPDAGAPPAPDQPSWAFYIHDAQKLLAERDFPEAQKKFKEALDRTTSVPATRAFVEQTRVAPTGPCALTGLGRPRTGLGGNEGRPTVAGAGKGAVVAWTDDHEQAGREHVYSVIVDASGRSTSTVRDLTPEAASVMRPSLLPAEDKFVLLYWDQRGREAGVRVRTLDRDASIAGGSVLVGSPRPGLFWPAITRIPTGGYFVVWQDDRDKEGEDLFVRRLTPELETSSPELRLTDYVPPVKGRPGPAVRYPALAVGANALLVAYRLDREGKHLIYRMRLPLDGPELVKGLEDLPAEKAPKRVDRELGAPHLVNEDRASADVPTAACGSEGCFVAWHGETTGASLARLDVEKGSLIWRKQFAPKGGRPTLLSTKQGEVYLVYFEGGRVRLAAVSRDGLGPVTAFGHISGDHPHPSVAQGSQKGELWVAWEDSEPGAAGAMVKEAYVARLSCP
ncbi:MAG: serine/threonine protein kinase [Myxococcales bacterium]|nr:serine/threonine protein kinase [Myxococcales bacterium]